MIIRRKHLQRINKLLRGNAVVAIVGARQVGKTTLAREIVRQYKGPTALFDLEDPADLSRLTEPSLTLRDLKGLVVIDEIQRRQDLFQILRVLADRPGNKTRFLILGSASPDLFKHSSESLAGRIHYYELEGFSLEEAGKQKINRLWLRGSFPRSFLAGSEKSSCDWRRGFIRTFLERDIPRFGITISSATLRRFWTMLAHYHAQVWNSSEFGRSFGIADTTVRRYLDILSSFFVVRQLLPWQENLRKRQVKSPKIYITDSGILHTLLNLETQEDISSHPKLGASWEGFLLGEVIRKLELRPEECFFWATHAGAELDLLVVRGRQRLGFEFKRTDAPTITASMRIALKDLKLSRIEVLHAGKDTYQLDRQIRAVSASEMINVLKPLA